MISPDTSELPSSLVLRLLVPLLDSHVIDTLGKLWQLGRRILRDTAHEGMYEVLSHTITLELCDPHGHKAIYSKHLQVRFLQNHIIAYQDQAWGDGDIFADYACSPGIPVDRYKEGGRYRILISLRETKNAGEKEEFQIQRTILDGFTHERELVETQVEHPTRWLSLSVIFPASRLPKSLTLIEQNSTRVTKLGTEHRRTLPDGREQVTWHTKNPRLFESYMLRWTW